jgi:hypothetical protein
MPQTSVPRALMASSVGLAEGWAKLGAAKVAKSAASAAFKPNLRMGGLFPVEVPPIHRRIRVVSIKTEAEP